ncbi:uncharacterized protein TNCT_648041 [Trichonephila clavata]|uniref:Uncharacterized protein n=1 Tax=Trichonephila clavata TaxID=2740835 RepID=A0A8X6J5S0_TRICU|nr:uncharacterized protein TNCT_648041 [Trichonephila clavata]
MPYHSRAPSKCVERYGTPVGLKTPILTNGASSDMYSHYEASPMIYDKSYGIPIDTLAYGAWGVEEYFEDENMNIEKEEYPLKRKNAFVYPPKESVKKGLHSLPPTRIKSNSLDKSNDLGKSTPKRQAILCSDTPCGLGFKLNQKEKKSSEILRDDFPKPYPKWNPLDSPSRSHNKKTDKTLTFPRIFTVTVEKLQTWPKVLSCGQTIFELFDNSLRVFLKMMYLRVTRKDICDVLSPKNYGAT